MAILSGQGARDLYTSTVPALERFDFYDPGARCFRRGEHGRLVRGLRGGTRALSHKRLQQRRGSTGELELGTAELPYMSAWSLVGSRALPAAIYVRLFHARSREDVPHHGNFHSSWRK